MTVTIRRARAADRDACLRLIEGLTGSPTNDVSHEVFAELLKEQRGVVLVAEEDELTLGAVTASFGLAIRYKGEYCEIEELIVSPDARGKNVGGLLVQGLVDLATDRGCAEIALYLIQSTEHNQPFYEKYGFERVGGELRLSLT
jgi:ribosomal protein S18 acetylase RimI-like enzyme